MRGKSSEEFLVLYRKMDDSVVCTGKISMSTVTTVGAIFILEIEGVRKFVSDGVL